MRTFLRDLDDMTVAEVGEQELASARASARGAVVAGEEKSEVPLHFSRDSAQTSTSMLPRAIVRSIRCRAALVAISRELRPQGASRPLQPFASPFTSTSRLTLDDDLGVPEPVPKPKPKGKAKTPPKYRPPKELPQLDEDDLEEQFVRGAQLSSRARSLAFLPADIPSDARLRSGRAGDQ